MIWTKRRRGSVRLWDASDPPFKLRAGRRGDRGPVSWAVDIPPRKCVRKGVASCVAEAQAMAEYHAEQMAAAMLREPKVRA